MHHKRHALELLELFKQSRVNSRPKSQAEQEEVDLNPLPRQEVRIEGFLPLSPGRVPDTSPSTSYLPKVTPVERRPSVMPLTMGMSER